MISALTRSAIEPLTINHFSNNEEFNLPPVKRSKTGLFFKIGVIDEVYIKAPTFRAYRRFRQYFMNKKNIQKRAEAYNDEIIKITGNPDIVRPKTINETRRYMTWVHIAHYNRLCGVSPGIVPKTYAGFEARSIRSGRFFLKPLIIQERVNGTRLWNMFADVDNSRAPLRWYSQEKPYVPNILLQIEPLRYSNDIDWNIQNFIYDQDKNELHYVDSKPALYVNPRSNEHNRNLLFRFLEDPDNEE